MAVRDILTFPHPVLRRLAEPVTQFGPELWTLVSDMLETMRYANGIGLAAPQVGESIRLIVVEIPGDQGVPPETHTLVNPLITGGSGKAKIEEGCLSCPGFFVEVERAEKITLAGQTLAGKPLTMDADGMLAICLQHEIDHLNGRLLVHQVSALKRELYRREIKQRGKEDGPPRPSRPVI